MSRTSLMWIIVVIIILAGGAYYASRNDTTVNTQTTTKDSQTGTDYTPDTTGTASSGADIAVGLDASVAVGSQTITYTDQGFTPSTLTIKKGTKVTFLNKSSKSMWVASDEHPTHTEYAGTSRTQHCPDTAGTAFDQCASGTSYTFTFDKAGSWEYHNHVSAADHGMIIVTQ